MEAQPSTDLLPFNRSWRLACNVEDRPIQTANFANDPIDIVARFGKHFSFDAKALFQQLSQAGRHRVR